MSCTSLGASSWNQTSPSSGSSFFKSDDNGILNAVTLLEASSGNFLKRRLDMPDSVFVDDASTFADSNQLSWSKSSIDVVEWPTS
jgi:hypothetical protein